MGLAGKAHAAKAILRIGESRKPPCLGMGAREIDLCASTERGSKYWTTAKV